MKRSPEILADRFAARAERDRRFPLTIHKRRPYRSLSEPWEIRRETYLREVGRVEPHCRYHLVSGVIDGRTVILIRPAC